MFQKIKRILRIIFTLPTKLLPHRLVRRLSPRGRRILNTGLITFLLFGGGYLVWTLITPNSSDAAWWNDSWMYRKAISVDGSVVDEDLKNFPVLVSLSSSNFTFSKAQSNGNDIRFTDMDGNPLSYEVVSWDSGAETAEVWVKLPVAYDSGTTFFMYYGNSQAQDDQNVSDVWSNNYSHVYHFNNSTKNSVDGDTSSGTFGANSIDTTGKIGKARSKQSPYSGNVFGTTQPRASSSATLETWYKPDGFRDWDDIISQGWIGNGIVLFDTVSGTVYVAAASSGVQANSGGGTLTDGQWSYVTGTYDGSTLKFYINGASNGTPNNVTGYATDLTSPIYSIVDTDRGAVDEMRISKSARSAAWVKASYNSGNNSLLTYSSEEKSPEPAAYWKFDEGTGTVANDSSGNNNTGALQDTPTWIPDSQCIASSCLQFNGTSEYISVANKSILNPTTGLTLMAWVKFSGVASSTNYNIIAKQDWGNKLGYRLAVSGYGCSTNCFFMGVGDGTNQTEFSTNKVNLTDIGKWHHLAGVFSSGNIYLYIDGQLIDSSTTSVTTISNTSSSLTLARHSSGGEFLPGFIDEPKVYNYALSAQQIKANYNSRGGGGGSVLGATQDEPLSQGLVGYWKMDQSSWNGTAGEVIDSSGAGNNGTAVSGAEASSSAKFGNAGYFAGVDESVQVNDSSTLDFGTGDFTVATWVNFNTLENGDALLGKFFTGSGPGYGMRLNSSLQPTFWVADGATASEIPYNQVLSAGTWYHVVGVRKSGVTTIYLNGQLRKDTTGSLSGSVDNSGTLSIGARVYTVGNINGNLDEIRIYNRALSPDEISNLYNFAPGPVAYYNMEEGGGSSLKDVSTYGNNGTFTGGLPSWVIGKYGKGITFENSRYASLGSPLNGSASWTYSAWIYPTKGSVSAADGIIGQVNNPRITWGPSVLNDRRIGVLAGWSESPGYKTISSPNQLELNKWHYVTAVFDTTDLTNQTLNLYINGVLVGSNTATTGTLTRPSSTHYINRRDSSSTFPGVIDEVRIYNYARTPGQIVEDMNAGHPLGGSPVGSQVGYWKFNEGYGTTTANSGNAGNALSGAITSCVWIEDAKYSRGLNCNGGGSVSFGSNSSLNASAFTYSFWIKPGVQNSGGIYQNIILGRETYTTNGFRMGLGEATSSNGKVYFWTGQSGGTFDVLSKKSITDGKWHYVAVTYDGTSGSIYIDGKLESTDTGTFVVPTGVSLVLNGGIGGTTRSNSQFDEFKFYNSALTPAQIKLDYNQGSSQVMGAFGLNPDGTASNSAAQTYCVPGDYSTTSCKPTAEWSFEEHAGATANDTSGNGYAATFNGNPIWTIGKIGSALNFNASSDYLSANAPTGSTWSISVWSKFPLVSTGSYRTLVRQGSGIHHILVDPSGLLGVYNGSFASSGFDVDTLSSGWHHITAIGTGGSTVFYVDGQQAGTSAQQITSNITQIGGIGSGQNWGIIDELRVYNYVLSSAQIAWDYNRGKPVAHYKLDECQGSTANDSSEFRNNGVITIGASGSQTSAGTCQTAGTAWGNGATGKFNYSLNFDGTDDRIVISETDLISPTAFSISTWVKPTNFSDYRTIFYRSGDPYCALQISTGYPYCYLETESARTAVVPNRAPSLGQWNHIVYTFQSGGTGNPSTFKIFLNGSLIKQDTTSFQGDLDSNSNPSQIGTYTTSTYPMLGQMDDFQIFNYALTPVQVRNIYNQSSAIRFGPQTGAP